MKAGNINCSCGQTFYFESAATGNQRTIGFDEDHESITKFFPPMVSCIRCAKEHDISAFPDKVETIEEQPMEVEFEELIDPPTEEGDGDGTNI